MDLLFADIPLGDVTTSMTISGPAVPVFCMYLVAAERQGVDLQTLDGTRRPTSSGIHRAEGVAVPRLSPTCGSSGDLMEYCAAEIPAYKPISCRANHIREAAQRPRKNSRSTLADGFAYVELGLSRGLDVNAFAPGLSFLLDSHVDFFEKLPSSARPPDLGQVASRHLRANRRAGPVAALPHPDRRCVSHRAAA